MADHTVHSHFVPAFYLSKFTDGQSRDSRFYVFDKERLKRRRSTPNAEAKQKLFYTPAVETIFEQFEGRWATAVSATISGGCLPTGDLWGDLMIFVGMTTLRGRPMRKLIGRAVDSALRRPMQLMASTDEGRDALRAILKAAGAQPSEQDFANMIAFIASGEYEIGVNADWHEKDMIELAQLLIPELARCKWKLWIADPEAPDLICSDHPVNLIPFSQRDGMYPVGFGTPDTLLAIPLNRRTVLVSGIDKLPPRNILDTQAVARLNFMQVHYGTQLFCAEPDFSVFIGGSTIGRASDLFASWKL